MLRDFDSLPEEVGPAVRSVTVLDPMLGPVVFIAVLLDGGTVEIADFTSDPDYWDLIGGDPDQL